MSQSTRENALRKIKALLFKTTENGCTEEEALTALSMAKALMDAYEVTDEDLEDAKKAEADISGREAHDPNSIRTGLSVAVARFTGTKCWKAEAKRYHSHVKFCGLGPDVELADWLLDSLSGFVTRELVKFLFRNNTSDRNKRRKIISGFVWGCLSRINERLAALADQSEVHRTSNGRALVVVKDQLIVRKMEEAGIKLRGGGSHSRRINLDAYAAGQAAGERATFNRPVGQGGGGPLLIGRK